MPDQTELPDLEILDVATCFELLGRCTIGRVGLNERLGPLVVPVNFVLDGEVIVFRTDEGAKLRAVGSQPVTFQVDWFDTLHETGWSVLVRGVARQASDQDVAHLDLRSWAGGEKRHWIRLVPGMVTGRRITTVDLPYDDRGYR